MPLATVVIDFGMVRAIRVPPEVGGRFVAGTAGYIAPEQVKLLPVTPKTDIYNFGATLYWALTGRNLPTLFTLEKSENSFLVDDKMSSPRDLNSGVPEQLSDLVMQCVRLSPTKRPEFSEIIRRMEVIEYATKRNQRNAFHAGPRMARAS